MQLIWWGQQDYLDIQRRQKDKVAELAGKNQIEIWGLEFNPTVTLGLRAKPEHDLRFIENNLENKNQQYQIIKTDRGGRATLHSPGQLVIFPMLDLNFHKIGVQTFVEFLFQTTVRTLAHYSIESHWKTTEAGVYTNKGKIAFCGLKIDSGVVRHGISINIKNDLKLFDFLVPCGNPSLSLDRILDHQYENNLNPLSLESFLSKWFESFQQEWKISSFS